MTLVFVAMVFKFCSTAKRSQILYNSGVVSLCFLPKAVFIDKTSSYLHFSPFFKSIITQLSIANVGIRALEGMVKGTITTKHIKFAFT